MLDTEQHTARPCPGIQPPQNHSERTGSDGPFLEDEMVDHVHDAKSKPLTGPGTGLLCRRARALRERRCLQVETICWGHLCGAAILEH
jgi:hypothetical protein